MPEGFGSHIDTDGSEDLLWRLRTAGGQEIQILRDKRRTLFLIHAVQCQHEQVPKAVGVAIERAGKKMGNGQPLPLKFIRYLYGLPELLPQLLSIGLRQLIGRCAIRDHLMGQLFEADEIGLPQHGGINVVQLAQQQALLNGLVPFLGHQGVGENAFPED